MKIRNMLFATTTIAALSAGAAFAGPVADAIATDLLAQGATSVEVKTGLFRIKVEAIIDGVKVERVYTLEGVLRKEETVVDGVETETTYDADGNVVKVEVDDESHDEGDDDDDDDEDDDDEDDDDEDDDDDDDSDDD